MNKEDFQGFVRDVASGKLDFPNMVQMAVAGFDPALASLHEARTAAVVAEQNYCRKMLAEMGSPVLPDPPGLTKAITVRINTESLTKWFEEQAGKEVKYV